MSGRSAFRSELVFMPHSRPLPYRSRTAESGGQRASGVAVSDFHSRCAKATFGSHALEADTGPSTASSLHKRSRNMVALGSSTACSTPATGAPARSMHAVAPVPTLAALGFPARRSAWACASPAPVRRCRSTAPRQRESEGGATDPQSVGRSDQLPWPGRASSYLQNSGALPRRRRGLRGIDPHQTRRSR